MDNCNCMEFGRECCLRNPEYQLSDDGTREYRNVACPDPSWSAWVLGNVGDYMHQLVEYFVSLGYQRGQTIRSERERGKYFPYENA